MREGEVGVEECAIVRGTRSAGEEATGANPEVAGMGTPATGWKVEKDQRRNLRQLEGESQSFAGSRMVARKKVGVLSAFTVRTG